MWGARLVDKKKLSDRHHPVSDKALISLIFFSSKFLSYRKNNKFDGFNDIWNILQCSDFFDRQLNVHFFYRNGDYDRLAHIHANVNQVNYLNLVTELFK